MLGVLALTQQLGYFNILPMYVVFMLLPRRSSSWPTPMRPWR
jgi:hypothetical protein